MHTFKTHDLFLGVLACMHVRLMISFRELLSACIYDSRPPSGNSHMHTFTTHDRVLGAPITIHLQLMTAFWEFNQYTCTTHDRLPEDPTPIHSG